MKKNIGFMILVLSLSLLITACSPEEVKYAFPLDSEVIEKVLAQEESSWFIEKSQSFQEGHTLYTLKNENDKIISTISSYSKDEMRHLGLNFFSISKLDKDPLKATINENEWEDMFKLACTLYGNSNDYKKVYREFVKYSNNRRDKEYGRAVWSKRIDNAHFKVTLNPLDPLEYGSKDFILRGIDIMNSDAYEGYSLSLVNNWKYSMDREEIEILENTTVSDIISMNEEDNDLVRGIIIKGHLENISKFNDNELPSTIFPNSKAVPYKEDYLSAKLVDETGSIQVVLRASSLNEEELGQVRTHHGYYFGKDNIYVIALSVLSE